MLLCNLDETELRDLQHLSARIGKNPHLIQGSNGNTSIKLNRILWIKASGKRLSQAMTDDIFVPVNLEEVRNSIENGVEPMLSLIEKDYLHPSIETTMHASIRQRVVVHIHSVNTIAWAIRADGPDLLKDRLADLNWQWVPYAPSGLPLAREIQRAVGCTQEPDVFILANHGLVVCGSDCKTVDELLRTVEDRLAVTPRLAPKPDMSGLAKIARFSRCQFPEVALVHALGTDAVSRGILEGGILYPCQAVFLGCSMPLFSATTDVAKLKGHIGLRGSTSPFLAVEGSGTLLKNNISSAELATLIGLVEVTQRIPESARVSYLTETDVSEILSHNRYHSQEAVAGATATMRRVPN